MLDSQRYPFNFYLIYCFNNQLMFKGSHEVTSQKIDLRKSKPCEIKM